MKIIKKKETNSLSKAINKYFEQYVGRVYTCPKCGVKFVIEQSDVNKIMSLLVSCVDKFWAEHSFTAYDRVSVIICEICGENVCLDIVEYGNSWKNGKIEIGGEIYKENTNENT